MRYEKVGYIPELGYWLLRNLETKKLELWKVWQGCLSRESLLFEDHELIFFRITPHAWRIVDTPFNRRWNPDEIGRIIIDEPVAYAETKEL